MVVATMVVVMIDDRVGCVVVVAVVVVPVVAIVEISCKSSNS